MQIRGNLDRMKAAIELASSAAAIKNSLSMTSTLLIKASGGRISFTGTDMRRGIETWLDADSDGEWTACVDAGRLSAAIKGMKAPKRKKGDTSPLPELVLRLDGDVLSIKLSEGLDTEIRLRTLPASRFPEDQGDDKGCSYGSMDAEDFIEGTRLCLQTAEKPASARAFLKAVKIESSDGLVTMASTNGKSLTAAAYEGDFPNGLNAAYPSYFMEIAAMAASGMETVRIGADAGLVHLRTENAHVWGNASDKFPDWRRVVPRNLPVEIEMDTAELIGILRLIQPVTDEKSRKTAVRAAARKVRIDTEGDGFGGHGTTDTPYTGEEFAFAAASEALIIATESVKTERLVLRAMKPMNAMMISAVPDDGITRVFMPMAL